MKGIEFGKIFVSSGTLNIFGEGWPYHRYYKMACGGDFDFSGAVFISKSVTLKPMRGNLILDNFNQPMNDNSWRKFGRRLFENGGIHPAEAVKSLFVPDCIRARFIQGAVLNSVGLTNRGIMDLLIEDNWQKRQEPFLISFVPMGDTLAEIREEVKILRGILERYLPDFNVRPGLQINVSCPNIELGHEYSLTKIFSILDILSSLNIPLDLKIGLSETYHEGIGFMREIESSGLCDCITCFNTLPWGKMERYIDWEGIFGSRISPLAEYGGGGLSGKPIFKLNRFALKMIRDYGITMPIKISGGIMSPEDAIMMLESGADAVEIGSVAILRPWRIKEIISAVKSY